MIEVVTHGGRHEDQDVQLRQLLLTDTNSSFQTLSASACDFCCSFGHSGCHGYEEGVLPQKNSTGVNRLRLHASLSL